PALTLQNPPPLISSLFPYTTLFRSWLAFSRRFGNTTSEIHSLELNRDLTPKAAPRKLTQEGRWSLHAVWTVDSKGIVFASGASKDRQSTRLNSSHLGISYAVFCLKK